MVNPCLTDVDETWQDYLGKVIPTQRPPKREKMAKKP